MKKQKQGVPPPSKPPRTAHQLKRDQALDAAGYTKKDVHRAVAQAYGKAAPSRSGVSAIIDNRYRDARVHRAFAMLILSAGERPQDVGERAITKAVAEYFPSDEPLYRSGAHPQEQGAGNANAARS
jgi:hypothetical protein